MYKLLFGALLVYTSVLELLRLWQLADRLYPGAVTLTSVCLLVVLPVVYLRRVSALSQTAYAVLCLLVLATVAMLASVLQRLCIVNLQTAALTQGDFLAAVRDQLTLYPEYLLPALWPEQDKRGRHTLLRLAAWALAFDVGMHLILELFYGAAMPLRIDPVHAAARCGALSIFNRLEWLQFILWVDAVKAELEAYKESLSANDLYAEFADKVALAKDARIVTNGNYVAIVIAGIANPDYAPIDTALETALNF